MPRTTAAASPATGTHSVDSNATRVGPDMKTASSATDSTAKAVCFSRGSGSRCVHRARTLDPIGGIADPATTAARSGHGSDQSWTMA